MDTKYLPDKRVAIFMVTIVMLLALLSSCGTTKYIPIETIKTEKSTLYERDSIYIDRLIEKHGDTTYITRYEYRLKLKTDSFIKIDSIPHLVEVPVVVNRLNGIQRFSIWGFWIVVIILLGYIGIRIFLKRG